MNRVCVATLSALLAGGGLTVAGCGSGVGRPPSTTGPAKTTGPANSAPATTRPAPPAPLVPESASAATGDIPDNQVFLTFRNRVAGYAIKYPEGWARAGVGPRVTFRDKNNLIRIVVARGGLPSAAAAAAEVRGQAAHATRASRVILPGGPALKLTYTTRSAPSPVTGKRVVLLVDRYEVARAGQHAVIDLGTPSGVDNVDAYRLIVRSFRWG
jgi:hypothetical protein